VTVGILLFQDLSVIALLLVVPVLSGQAGIAALPGVIGYTLVVLVVVVVLGYLVLPPFLALVARSGRREAFVVAVLLASIGTAWFSARLGVSMAIGAFLGGLVLAEGDVSHQVLAEIRPLRDLLATLFFVSLGMLLDLRAVGGHLPLIIALAFAIVVTGARGVGDRRGGRHAEACRGDSRARAGAGRRVQLHPGPGRTPGRADR
jgi:CPA2 family monovalent cation:H+ antiporter-2